MEYRSGPLSSLLPGLAAYVVSVDVAADSGHPHFVISALLEDVASTYIDVSSDALNR